MKMTIGKRIIIGFTTVIILASGMGIFAYYQTDNLGNQTDLLADDALAGSIDTGRMATEINRGRAMSLAFLLSTNDAQRASYVKQIEENQSKLREIMEHYKSIMILDENKQLFNKADSALGVALDYREQAMKLSADGQVQSAQELAQTKMMPAYVQANEAFIKLADWSRDRGLEIGKTAEQTVSTAKTGIVIVLSIAVLVGIVIAFFIIATINKALTRMASSLGEGSEQVSAAAQQVSAASQSLAQGASEQAASLEETSSSLEEMSSMTKKNAETSLQASSLSSEAQKSADKGNEAMIRMSSAISEIQKSAQETAKIIKVIDEIAFQTNLLALNAAVEAARAGEAGKGFAVVAEEVRNLAMRSAEAAKNTSALIEESVQNSRNGVTIAQEVGNMLEEITAANTKVNTLISEIAAASQEQSQGIGQVNTAVAQMDKVTQSNAANAEESASASEELAAQAEQMSGMVNELVALVGGTAKTTGQSQRHRSTGAGKIKMVKPPVHKGHAIPLSDEEEQSFADFSKAA
ncbi:MAG: MCP four helix bundle domain-containing protein [Phycisphaerales bacterium]|nr:MCP four helix bundle domain-containing protein [Phycisphaerales bacterium]